MKKILFVVILTMALLAIFLTGCGSSASTPTPTPPPLIIGEEVTLSPDLVEVVVGRPAVIEAGGWTLTKIVGEEGIPYYFIPNYATWEQWREYGWGELNFEELQEHSLRQLASACEGDCSFSLQGARTEILEEMAVTRESCEECSAPLKMAFDARFTRELVDDVMEHDERMMAEHGRTARTGFLAMLGMSLADNAGDSFAWLAIAAAFVLVILIGMGVIQKKG